MPARIMYKDKGPEPSKHTTMTKLLKELNTDSPCPIKGPKGTILPSTFTNKLNMKQSTDSASRRPPMLYPSPGKLPGSRKRRAFSSHGPHSVSHTAVPSFSDNEKVNDDTPDLAAIAKVSPVTFMNDSSKITSSSNCLSPILTPKPKKNDGPHDEPLPLTLTPNPISGFKTPGRSCNSNCTLSPMTREMTSFQHLSIRSPMVSESPSSSFSRYTKSPFIACGNTVTTQGSFDSGDLSKSLTPSHCSNKMKTVPLTLLSPSPRSHKRNQGSQGTVMMSPVLSSNKLLSPKPRRSYLSPKTSFLLPSPKPQNRPAGGSFNSQAPIVTIERPISRHRSPFENTDVSPMMSLSPIIKANAPLKKDEEMSSPSYPPPPITFLSINENDGEKEKSGSNGDENIKRRSVMQTSVSMFKPAPTFSNGALNEMMYPNDTDGSLSDSDDEGNAFFLGDPSCLLQPPSRKSMASMLSRTSNNQGDVHGPPLTGASLSKCKKTKLLGSWNSNEVTQQEQKNGDFPIFPTLASNAEKKYTSQQHINRADMTREKSSASLYGSTTSLFGMNIIHENSISNVSLVEMGSTFISKRNSSKNLIDSLSSSGQSSSLNRVGSDQSISSLGLCLEGVTPGQYSNRDMITPPVVSRDMSSPPPLKQTKLTNNRMFKEDAYV
jgi:hypothetical protein